MAKIAWTALMAQLSDMDEPTLDALLEEEITTHKRGAVVRRLHQRVCKLRAAREREALMIRMSA